MYNKNKLYYIILISASLASTVFWTSYGLHTYSVFFDAYYDIGNQLQSFYALVNNPQAVSGLQYLVIGNHVSIDDILFVLPFFYLYPSPFTLFLIQAIVLSFTSVLVFFVGKELTKNTSIPFVLGLAYLLNPGTDGMLYFDFHAEFLIIPLFLCTFYFYMKLNKKMFCISLILLLLSMDTVVFIVAALGLGLLYYELVYDKNKKIKKGRIVLSLIIILGAIGALVFYLLYYNAIIPMYTSQYIQIPKYMYADPFDFLVLNNLLPPPNGSVLYTTSLYGWLGYLSAPLNLITALDIIVAVLVGLVAFGITIFADPILTLLLTAPWLIQLVVLRHIVYGFLSLQYFSYVLGGSIIAALLGILIINQNRGLYKIFKKGKKTGMENSRIINSILIFSLIAMFLGLLLRPTAPSPNPACISDLNNIIAQVPQNASLMTTPFIAPHVADRISLELMYYSPNQSFVSFKPSYILSDSNSCFANDPMGDNETFHYFFGTTIYNLDNYTDITGYHIVAQNGTAELWAANQS